MSMVMYLMSCGAMMLQSTLPDYIRDIHIVFALGAALYIRMGEK